MGKRETIVAYVRKQLGCAYSYTPSGGKEGSSYKRQEGTRSNLHRGLYG